ncbi:molybdopterin-dependent oxidoreductase [Nonomuraea phyllanthi]|uniref:xanthine dehydrogenase family protein molybdopterin-binding subunit n=1 Tax=Nonomuraea phyllanthi TaxID=2219224 RepID=UPI001293B0E1|nr:xanthine dehydrogenase family protein molybdopterin-binding subunit [Nonomuraea phyllanthi]QFY10224.1 molybdopterin-dependent oxidoreductase [Nonomuraea phyllanthi]
MTSGYIGVSVERDDLAFLDGTACYVADVDREGQLYARVVRSPVAHARILDVDVAEALAQPGVVAVITAADIPETRIPIRLPMAETPYTHLFLQPPLAREAVRYVGEPVAVVVASDPYLAEDAAELVDVDFDELDVVSDILSATTQGTPLVHAEAGTNIVATVPLGYGDVEAAFARADVVIRDRLRMHRHTAVPMETRGLLAEMDHGTGVLTLWGAAKVKHFTRSALSSMLGIERHRIRLVENHVGGGFGVRGEPYPEDFLVAFLALRLGRPIKWIEDRAEHFVATNHAREQEHDLEIAATADGRLLAFRDRAWCDQGAYVRSQGILPALLPALHLPGPYRWEAFSVETQGVLTNRTPVGTYRGPGMTEATFVRERMLDKLAAELRLDPAELRRRNLIRPGELPFSFEPAPITYESGDFPAGFEHLLDEVGYDDLCKQRQVRRASGEHVGIGFAAYTEIGAIGPFEEARIVPRSDGRFVVHVGVASLGQGVETVLGQIAAEKLGVPMDAVSIDHHDTEKLADGFGAFASRSTTLAGNAVALAAEDLRAKAAARLDVSAGEIRFVQGQVREPSGRTIPLAEVGEGRGRFDKPHPTFSFGAALSLVSIDRETGLVKVLRHAVLHDVGRAVNPELLRRQLAGAASQGIGAALLEELLYDEYGQPQSTIMADYRMPTVEELPDIEVIVEERPNTANPLGVKGGGESGMVGTPAAIANAVADALGVEGARVWRLPLTPDRVREMLRHH